MPPHPLLTRNGTGYPYALALAAPLLAAAQLGAGITIQPCFPTSVMPAEQWTVKYTAGTTGSVQQGSGACISLDTTGGVQILTAACDASDPAQQWTFHADGTVESVSKPGQCWNVWGGAVSPGTIIGMYACGSVDPAAVAKNDVFQFNASTQQLLAVESGLCLSTSVPPPGICASDADCNLNGACNTSMQCTCYLPWAGSNCGEMAVLPVNPVQGYGMQPNLTSWGGNVVYYQGAYHLYVAEMVNHCPLSDWGSNSQVSHAVASTPTGPYNFSDTALPVWAHNPQVVMYSNGTTTGFALFHIGDANGGSPKNCSSTLPGGDGTRTRFRQSPRSGGAVGSALHVATSPYGPWTPVLPGPPSCNNPAPMLHPNGTWYLLCDSTTLYSAPSVFGPWATVTTVPTGGVDGTYEDAFLYLDQRSNWHVLYHVYNATTPCGACTGELVSGHSFSADGLTWRGATVQPFGNIVQLTTGETWTVSTRERPKLLFDASGNPTHLLNGVCGGTSTCPPTPAVNCKYNYWDFTLVQPLAS